MYKDKNTFLENLKSFPIYSNGLDQCPLKTIYEILEALDYVLPDSYVYVFTDATENDYEYAENVITALRKLDAHVREFAF